MTEASSPSPRKRAPWPRRALVHVAVALGYGLSCTLVADFALPMLFASVIWLPAGVAFGMVYILGYRVLPALYVGAILGLLSRVIQPSGALAPGVTATETIVAVLLESGVVVGHAALGTWLVRRYVPDRSLTTVPSASRYLLLAGPVACLVGATFGPPAMLIRSIIATDGIIPESFGWFIGDGLGVLLLAPMVAVLAGPRSAWSGRAAPIAAMSIATMLALVAAHTLVYQSEISRLDRVFDVTTSQYVERAQFAIDRATRDLDEAAARVEGGGAPQQLAAVVDRIEQDLPGTRSVEVLTRRSSTAARGPGRVTVTTHGSRTDAPRELVLQRSVADPAGTTRYLLRVRFSLPALLRATSNGKVFDETGVAASSLTRAGARPAAWHSFNMATGHFLVDGAVDPDAVLRPHRAAVLQQLMLPVADRELQLALAPTTTSVRRQPFLLAAIPLAAASMLFAFTAGVFMLVLTGRTVRLANIVEARTTELARSERRYRTVVDNVADVIFRADEQGRLLFVNRSWFDVVDGATVEGRTLQSFVDARDLAPLEAAITRTMRADSANAVELVDVRLANTDPSRWVQLRMRTELDEQLLVGTIVDTTTQHELEAARAHFVSLVSHEFRTPVTVISGAVETIEQREASELPPIARALLPAMRSASRRLLRLVEDLLLAARIDAGTMRFERDRFDLAAVVRVSGEGALHDAVQSGVRVQLALPEGELWMIGDADRIGQLVDNLLSNAIKFSDAGGTVTITVEQSDDEVLICVRDEGIGIAAEEIPRLFDRFWRSRAQASAVAGTGLGLSICRQIVEGHGGRIDVDSVVGVGSTFLVRLPRGM